MIDFKNLVKNYESEALNTLSGLIKINSVYDANTVDNDMPYGKGVKEAMNYMKNIALNDGFSVDTCDNIIDVSKLVMVKVRH